MLHTISRQRATFIFIITLLCFIGLFSPVQGRAADLPDRAEVQSQLNTLNKQKELTPQDKLVQQDLTQTLETLDKIERIKSETAQLRQQVEQAPAKLRQAVESLNNLSDVPNDDATRKTLSTLSLRQLESRVTQTLDDLQNAQNDLATYNSQLVSLQTQPERVQNAMFNASQQLQQIRNRLNGTSVGDETLRPTQQVLLQAQQALLNAQIEQQRKSLEGNTILQDTLQKQRDYVTAWSNRLEHQLQLLQEAVNSKRLTLTEKTAQEAVTPDETARIQANPLVKQELDINHQLSEKLIQATENGNQLMMAINLQINQQQLMSVSSSLKEILTQQIFWVNSNKPMDWEWIKAFPGALKGQFKAMKITVNWEKAWPAVFVAFLAGLPLLLIAGLIRWRLQWLKDYQAKLASQVGQLRNDTQLHTPKAILIDLIRALPVVLLILAIGLILLTMQLNISGLLWAYSKKLAMFWLVFGLCWKVLEKNGVAVNHFNMPAQLTSHWRRQIVRVSLALLPLNFWSVISELSPLNLMDDVLGQLVIFFNLLLIAVLVWPMCRESWRDKESHSLRLLTITVLSIVPVALMVLTATGYFYTTLRLAGRWIETVYLVMIWNLLYQTVLRGLSVAARRIAWRRALARRQHLVKEGAEGAEPQEEPTIALEQVNQQTLRITMLVMVALFAVMFWAIWSDLITVFAYLDSITLWHYNGTEAGASVVRSVTMGSLLFAIVASMVAWALIRNLPGLLEVLVLSRLNMRQGTSYAITTILNYAIIAIGAMTVFGALGVSWDKLQWLAAALSVGLGFGLQEIFGNFVSGLIILFERPVRIGDTVTIGTFSGTVSKIRIRATTITDFDRKEVIIPNKAFVTERLINWSLSDTVTRVVIRLGVAYGSDLDKVKEVLLKAAHDHPKVMQEPAPAVFFTTFGASTLDHELRLYVRELRDRSYTVDELNRAIDRLCRENDINIAFNQLEVHLRNEKGDEVTEVKRDGKGDDLAPTTAS